jgi:hypothetical protein
MVKQNLINMVKHRVDGCDNIRMDPQFQIATIKCMIAHCEVQALRTQGLAQNVVKRRAEKRKVARAQTKRAKQSGGPSKQVGFSDCPSYQDVFLPSDILCLVIVPYDNQFQSLSDAQVTNLQSSSAFDDEQEEEDSVSTLKQSRAVLPSYLVLSPEAAAKRIVLTDYSLGQYKLPTALCKVIYVLLLLSVALESTW